MDHEIGTCRKCGKDLMNSYGDLGRRTSKSLSTPGSLMTEAIHRSGERVPIYCKACVKSNRKEKIQKIIGFFRRS